MIDLKQEVSRAAARFKNDIEVIARRASLSVLESVMPAARGRRERSTKGKRSPSDLGELEDRFETFVRANPGLRIEQINRRLGTTTKELVLPIHKLIAKGAIVTEGRVRSTTYFPRREHARVRVELLQQDLEPRDVTDEIAGWSILPWFAEASALGAPTSPRHPRAPDRTIQPRAGRDPDVGAR